MSMFFTFRNLRSIILLCFYIGAEVSLQDAELSVLEGDSNTTATVELCVILTDTKGGLHRDVVLSLSTTEETASMQYNLFSDSIVPTIAMFNAGEQDFLPLTNQELVIASTVIEGESVCTNITVVGDDILEANETFTVFVAVNNSNDRIIGPITATVIIIQDGDGGLYCIDMVM